MCFLLRQKSSGAEGERLKEATNINKSLSTLGCVVATFTYSSDFFLEGFIKKQVIFDKYLEANYCNLYIWLAFYLRTCDHELGILSTDL